MQNDIKSLCRFDRLASHSKNQPYTSMQGKYRRGGRAKRQKLSFDESVINETTINEFANYDPPIHDFAIHDSAINGFAMNDSTMNDFAINDFAMNDFAIHDAAINNYANNDLDINDSVIIELTFCDSLELGQYINANTYKIAYDNGIAILDEYYLDLAVDSRGVDDILTFNTLLVSWDKSA
jgi:hypothetical protein